MNVKSLLQLLQPYDESVKVYIASTVLMPLKTVRIEYDQNQTAQVHLVQQRFVDKENGAAEFSLATLKQLLTSINEHLAVMLVSNYVREIESIECVNIADTVKTGENKIVAAESAWKSHPVFEHTVRKALIINTPL